MGKLESIGRVLECFINTRSDEFDDQTKPLIAEERRSQQLRLKDVISDEAHTQLALPMKPRVVVLKVSIHCNGCAKKVEKLISKIEGVASYKVDLESKMVVVAGDIFPFEVLQCISKVKSAEFW